MKTFKKGQKVYKINHREGTIIKGRIITPILFTGWEGWYSIETEEEQEVVAPYYELYETKEEAEAVLKELKES